MSLRAEGRTAEAGLIKEALNSSPTRASKIINTLKEAEKATGMYDVVVSF